VNLRKFSTSLFVLLISMTGFACSTDSVEENSSSFCRALEILANPNSSLGNLDFDNPKSVNQTVADLIELGEIAPASIADDTQSVASLYEDILLKLVSVSPNQRTNELRKFQNELDNVTTAARALESYGEIECGLVFTSPFEPSTVPTPSEIQDE
tara:strand:- start:937 stop:1401 length:465 start_codon:yes stop_codon:yes gene_type:complete